MRDTNLSIADLAAPGDGLEDRGSVLMHLVQRFEQYVSIVRTVDGIERIPSRADNMYPPRRATALWIADPPGFEDGFDDGALGHCSVQRFQQYVQSLCTAGR